MGFLISYSFHTMDLGTHKKTIISNIFYKINVKMCYKICSIRD